MVSFTRPRPRPQDNAVELVVDQARRLAARGSDAVVLIDTLDGLHPLVRARRSPLRGSCATAARADGDRYELEAAPRRRRPSIALDADARDLWPLPGTPTICRPRSGAFLRPELLVGVNGAKAVAEERVKASK